MILLFGGDPLASTQHVCAVSISGEYNLASLRIATKSGDVVEGCKMRTSCSPPNIQYSYTRIMP